MARRVRIECAGALYHVINRRNSRSFTFDRPVLFRKGNGYWTVSDSKLTPSRAGGRPQETVQKSVFDYDGLGNLKTRSDHGGGRALTETFT